MAINKNHEFEDLNGIKCAIVERNASAERVEFLKKILAYNGYEVVVVPSPPAKASLNTDAETQGENTPTPTYTIGVTDVTFNPVNAIFGRLLKAPGNKVVTLAYWKQEEDSPNDEIPYYEKVK